MIKVLIAEDSPVIRELLAGILEQEETIRIVGMANNGAEAVKMAYDLRPDVITMDIRMPQIDGLEATRLIMEQAPTRIIVVTGSTDQAESRPAFEAIKAGALTLIEKPRGYTNKDFESIRNNLIKTIKIMSEVKVVTRRRNNGPAATVRVGKTNSSVRVVAIGASTGGPAALNQIFKALPENLPVPIVVVQHMTTGFGGAFASWLNTESAIPVKIAAPQDELTPGKAFIAPDNHHLGVDSAGRVRLTEEKLAYKHHRPSINYMFDSIARSYGRGALGVLLTGMGEDGAEGLSEIRKAGGRTIAQDEDSCVVFGMPKSAIALGVVDRVLPLNKIASAVLSML
jgi:two-component system, chemotaxis family, protein-glutamate methylesterase/glutaminase